MRRTSFKILYDVFFNEILLNDAINKYFELEKIKDEDKAFIKRETSGVIENINDIDSLIDKYSKVRLPKLNKDILIVLRLGIYEMKYMDKVPVYATINEYVDIIKKSKSGKLSGFVNAVLRNISRDLENKEVNIKDIAVDKKNAIEKKCYFKIYNDKEKEVLTELDNKGIKYSKYDGDLRFNFARVYSVNKYKEIIDTESFKAGYVLIEDASSIYMIDRLTSFIKESEPLSLKILDTCSAPGGKILSLLDTLSIVSDRYVINAKAYDVSGEKIEKISENVKRLKISDKKNIRLDIKVQDATKYDETLELEYDVVICDVPCTGLGVIAKKPDVKLNYTEVKRNSLVRLQRQILNVSRKYVKKGGILSYSTCTTTKEENEENIKYFLSNNKNFEKIYEKKIELNDGNFADGFYMCFMKNND